MKRIEVLVFEGCPNREMAVARARAAAGATDIPATVDVVVVQSDEEAIRARFLGSPTVRVDGVDVDRSAAARDDFALQCRLYSVQGRLEGAPPSDWIEALLRGEMD